VEPPRALGHGFYSPAYVSWIFTIKATCVHTELVCPVVHRVVVIGYLVSSGEHTGLSLSVHRVFLKRAIFDLVMIPGMV